MTEAADETPTRRQRVGAYGSLTRERHGRIELLLTRIAPKDYGAGMWTLPGGGIDHGEHPDDAVVREFYEETSLRVVPTEVAAISNLHVIGRNRAGVLEDFQGVGIIYQVAALAGSDLDSLTVIEEDSSTDRVEWVAIEDLSGADRVLTNVAVRALEVVTGQPAVEADHVADAAR